MLSKQWVGFCTILRREWVRMFRIKSQVFFPPVMQTLLYFLIFGHVIGARIGDIDGRSYMLFIAPGLVMMNVITNAYSNVSTSLFNVRFQRSIEEMLVSPLHGSVILAGYVVTGMLRGFVVAVLVLLTASFFLSFPLTRLLPSIVVILMVSMVFSLAGFLNGMLARNFDEVAFVPTFVLTPLTYLGGVFYTAQMLPPFWQTVTQFNPLYYMINALRSVLIGASEVSFMTAVILTVLILIVLTACNLFLLKKGIGLKG